MEHLYRHTHCTDPETPSASSQQNWTLKSRVFGSSASIFPTLSQPPRLSQTFSRALEAQVGCLLLAGTSFQASGSSAEEGGYKRWGGGVKTQRQSVLLSPSFTWEEGMAHVGEGGLWKSIIYDGEVSEKYLLTFIPWKSHSPCVVCLSAMASVRWTQQEIPRFLAKGCRGRVSFHFIFPAKAGSEAGFSY